jgi:L-ascorbate metabolism protein UlaG (beta-lactamase superfamily)
MQAGDHCNVVSEQAPHSPNKAVVILALAHADAWRTEAQQEHVHEPAVGGDHVAGGGAWRAQTGQPG